ncbi:MAG: hypothetical protein LH472_02830 [Pyrinomonadaceae bacterium]|nr:hypothetical protein [Pyrinomonadaceae bacterium]
MSQVLNREISEAQEKSFLREIDRLFLKLKENNEIIVQENNEIKRLRKTNDKSFLRLKKAIENLQNY